MDHYYYYAIEVMLSNNHTNSRTFVCENEDELDAYAEMVTYDRGYEIRRYKLLIQEQMRGGKLCKMVVGESQ